MNAKTIDHAGTLPRIRISISLRMGTQPFHASAPSLGKSFERAMAYHRYTPTRSRRYTRSTTRAATAAPVS